MTPSLATQLIVFNGHIEFETDPDAVLAAAAAAGFRAVETQLADPVRLRDRLADHGLRHAAAHVTPSQLQDPQPWIDYLQITGARDLCTSGLLHWHQRSVADHDETIAILNRAGRALRAAGMFLHYHNHDFELTEHPVPGRTTLDYLLERFEPDAVDLCVDVAWLHRAGLDPAGFLAAIRGRVGYVHIKDWNGTEWAPPGRGQVDLASVVRVLPQLTNLRWVTCEQDTTTDKPAKCLQLAHAWCRQNLPQLV